jgi:hypothetical protein
MKALDLIKESNEILQLADGHPGVRLVGQSKEEARRLLNNVKACRMEFRELRIPENDEVLITLINARRDLLRVLTESDNFEYANGTRAAAAAPRRAAPLRPASRRASRRLDYDICWPCASWTVRSGDCGHPDSLTSRQALTSSPTS